MSILEKNTITTVIPGVLTTTTIPGSPGAPAYCATTTKTVCGYHLAPGYSIGYVKDQHGELVSIWFYNGAPIPGTTVYSPYVYSCQSENVFTCYPAVAATPSTVVSSYTASQIVVSKNLGWNTHSRSINAIVNDNYIRFNVPLGVQGVFVGIWLPGKDSFPITAFPHGMIIDLYGARIYESGVAVHTLITSYTADTEFRIIRKADGSIEYKAGDQTYVSLVAHNPADELTVYCFEYAGGDRVLDAAYKTLAGEAATGASVVMDQSMTGDAVMSPFTAFGSELMEFTTGYAQMPAFASTGDATSAFVPATLITAFAAMQTFVSAGLVQFIEIDVGNTTLPSFVSLGGDYDYGVASAWMPALVSYGLTGNRLEMDVFSGALAIPQIITNRMGVLMILSNGQLQSVQTMQVAVLMDVLSGLLATGIYDVIGEFVLNINSQMYVQSAQILARATGAALDDGARVWVVNMDTGASVQYDDYGFNSYFVRDGEAYGVADDGIYKLQGDDDAGAKIDALIDFGKTKFMSPKEKRVLATYITTRGSELILKVEADGLGPYYYSMRSHSDYLDTHRVSIGKGVRGTEWSFTLLNQDGQDFELAELEFMPIDMSRRI